MWNQLWLTLRNLIEALARSGHAEPAAVLYGGMRASPNATPVSGADALRLSGVLDEVAVQLGAAAVTEHQKRGAGLGDAGAVAYAHDVLRGILGGAGG